MSRGRFDARLGKLRTIWPPEGEAEMPPWIPAMIENAAESAEYLALRRQARVRGERRRLAESGRYPTEDEGYAATNRELDELLSLASLTPDDPAGVLARWYAGAEGWPAGSAWPFTPAELARDSKDWVWRKEESRSCPALEPFQAELRAEMARIEPLTTFCQTLVRSLDDGPRERS